MIHSARFIGSFPRVDDCPASELAEYAFIGRSNVGKSSLINLITGRKALAKVSSTPGKTQMINFFSVDDSWHLVDLPGYGYARVSKKDRAQWEKMIKHYLLKRTQLSCLFILLDASIGPQEIDMDFLQKIGEAQIPFAIVFTKTDKDKQQIIHSNIESIKAKILEEWEALPEIFLTSSSKNRGRDNILSYIQSINHQFYR